MNLKKAMRKTVIDEKKLKIVLLRVTEGESLEERLSVLLPQSVLNVCLAATNQTIQANNLLRVVLSFHIAKQHILNEFCRIEIPKYSKDDNVPLLHLGKSLSKNDCFQDDSIYHGAHLLPILRDDVPQRMPDNNQDD